MILKGKSDQRRMQDVFDQLNYYNSVSEELNPDKDTAEYSRFLSEPSISTIVNKDYGIGNICSYDLVDLMGYFGLDYSLGYDCGDATTEPNRPAFIKSHPIKSSSHNGILLELDAIRRFSPAHDPVHFHDKEPMAVFQGSCHQRHRKAFMERCHDLPDVSTDDTWKSEIGKATCKSLMTIMERLRYQFIISIEGNSVAMDLKQIMASNSFCFMRRSRHKTWFVEGRLIPGVYYVLLKDDYSGFQEGMDHYRGYPGDALAVIRNANRWVMQFLSHNRGCLLGLMVITKYFRLSGQQAFWWGSGRTTHTVFDPVRTGYV